MTTVPPDPDNLPVNDETVPVHTTDTVDVPANADPAETTGALTDAQLPDDDNLIGDDDDEAGD